MEIEDRSPFKPAYPGPSAAARGALEKELREWGCYTEFSKGRKKPELSLKILNLAMLMIKAAKKAREFLQQAAAGHELGCCWGRESGAQTAPPAKTRR